MAKRIINSISILKGCHIKNGRIGFEKAKVLPVKHFEVVGKIENVETIAGGGRIRSPGYRAEEDEDQTFLELKL